MSHVTLAQGALALTLGHRYYVELAASGPGAIEKLRAHPKMSVIVSDMQMPDMDGAQFFHESRQIAPDARRILLTGHADLSSAIAAVNDGRIFRYMTKPCDSAVLIEAIEAAIVDYEAEKRECSAIRQLAKHEMLGLDRLTGLISREGLVERLCLLQGQRRSAHVPGPVLFLAEVVGSSEAVEDYDWRAAEKLLCVLADRLKAEFAMADCLARYGSNSLALLLSCDQQSSAALELIGLRIIDTLDRPIALDGAEIKPSIRVGIAIVSSEDEDPRVVLRHAELAAQEAIRADQIFVSVYSTETSAKAEFRRDLGRALRVAIAREELILNYQPIIDVGNHRLHSVEALCRWHHSQLGFVSPASFIPLAESMNLMVVLGDLVLNRACVSTRELLGPECPRLSVNVSISQIVDVNFMSIVHRALDTHRIEPTSLELEITESLFAKNLHKVCGILLELKNWGISIAIDDFGAGYSSLHYLNQMPVDVIKVDGAFARDFDRGGEAIIGAALSIAKSMKLECIIEGIETQPMLEKVLAIGASKIQGYVFAKPMTEADLKDWLVDFGDQARLRSRVGPLSG